jgi:8-oxo-dGTP pyrophosphatase MutT (NUDIX family)
MALKLHHRLLQQGYLAYSRLARGMTLGVRAMLLQDDRVVLVKHSYIPGWYLPGGGVEAGESLGEALERELREEVGAVLAGPPQLFGVYRNGRVRRSDHVALYVCRDWRRHAAPRLLNREIVACEMFGLDALPAGASPATLARIREVVDGEPPSTDW